MTPLHLLRLLTTLLSVALLGVAIYLIWSGYDHQADYVEADEDEWRLWFGWGLLLLSFTGRFLWPMLLAKGGGKHPPVNRAAGHTLTAPDGSQLRVETYGAPSGPTLVFTHGWGLDSTVWRYARAELGGEFRLVVWDLPGLGKSKGPGDGKHTLERYAQSLRTVVESAGPGPVVLVGHSIGGMTIQTLCALHPELLGDRIRGVVLLNTTHLRPVETTAASGLMKALWPVLLAPAAKLMIWLEPLFHLMAWQSYLSGQTHLAVRIGGFGRHVTRSQLEHTSLLTTKNRPGVQAKGDFAMMDWDVTHKLPDIRVPALVVTGDVDLLTKEEAGETIARLIPGARREKMEGCGHMGFYEYAPRYHEVIADFARPLLAEGAQAQPAGVAPMPSPGHV
ncbi:MAG TPA: alpha/beta hydrolase [Caulobacteraceae bacterium]|jgi:pimeloyl-ACP methyl ester carboxylesterase